MMNAELVTAGEVRFIMAVVDRDTYRAALRGASRIGHYPALVKTLSFARKYPAHVDESSRDAAENVRARTPAQRDARGRRCRSAPSAAITHLTPSLTSSGRARGQAARQAVGTSALRLRARGLRELSRHVGSCLPQQRGGDRLGIDAVDGRPGVRTGHGGAQKHSHHCRWPPQLVRSWPLRWRAEGVRVLLRVLMSPPPP